MANKFSPYQPRRLRSHDSELHSGYQLKKYSICISNDQFDQSRFSDAFAMVNSELTQPAKSQERPGLGFTICHQGRTGDYLILCWWDRENELPTRVFVRDEDGWRKSAGESFCVWDLRVLWWEREAYVATMLADRDDGAEAYLAMRVDGYA